jgi:hypothetical protein
MDYLSAPVLPWLGAAFVEGMYGGRWSYKRQRSGWYEARCVRGIAQHFSYEQLIGETNTSHRPPLPGCGCGFWAYWKPTDSSGFFNQRTWLRKFYAGGYEVTVPLSGVIDGAGAVIIGEKGFRAERARITDISVPASECVYEEETGGIGHLTHLQYTANPLTHLRYTANPVAEVLSDMLGVPKALVQQTIDAAVTLSLGGNLKRHATPELLCANCPPDSNYGG